MLATTHQRRLQARECPLRHRRGGGAMGVGSWLSSLMRSPIGQAVSTGLNVVAPGAGAAVSSLFPGGGGVQVPTLIAQTTPATTFGATPAAPSDQQQVLDAFMARLNSGAISAPTIAASTAAAKPNQLPAWALPVAAVGGIALLIMAVKK